MNMRLKFTIFTDHTKTFFSNLDVKYLAIFFSLLFFVYYFYTNLITAYGDSKGHLNISRRVFDSLTPGLAQLGGYWLPALHVLMMPTIWIDFFWSSGISGSIVSMFFYVIAVVFIYKLAYQISNSKSKSFIASLIVVINPNLLYMQTTPMTESMFLGVFILFLFYFYKYIKYKKVTDLVISAVNVLVLTLTRYEGWGVLSTAFIILFINYIKDRKNFKKEGQMLLFTSLAVMGTLFWMLWGLIIFFDPFEFMNNDLSAYHQSLLATQTSQTGYKNIFLAVLTNYIAIIHVNGFTITLLATIGFSYILYQHIRLKKILNMHFLFYSLLLSPYLFDVISVYTGNVPVEVKELSGRYFNIRYALFSLPFISIVLLKNLRSQRFKVACTILILINSLLLIYNGPQNIILLKESGVNLKSFDPNYNFFINNYDNGLVLASTGSMDGFMFDTKIPQKNFISEGSFRYWQNSMQDPSLYAKWIIISTNNERDLTNRYINKEVMYQKFNVLYDNSGFQILKIK